MQHRGRRSVGASVAFLGICLGSAGCQTSGLSALVTDAPRFKAVAADSRPQETPSTSLAPRMSVVWSVRSADGQPVAEMRGEGTVGPNGSIELGPYGSVAVAGLPIAEARSLMEHHLARYLKDPKVSLDIAVGSSAAVHDSTPAITVGQVVPVAGDESAAQPVATVAATTPASESAPAAAEPSPLSGTPASRPLGEQPAAPTDVRWQAIDAPGGFVPTTESASTWRVTHGNGAALEPVTATGWRARSVVVAGPEQAVKAQPEPGAAEIKVYPRRVGEPGDAVVAPPPVAVDMGHGPGAPHEHARVALPPYVIDPPDVLLIESTQKLPDQPIRGQHLVRPDGTIGLGIYGSAFVAGLTLDQAKEVIAAQLATRIKDFETRNLSVDVLAYNSKFYYVVTDGGGYGEQVIRLPITGNETVLDAISQIGGLNPVSSKKQIWVARTVNGHHGQQILPVDWCGITQGGAVATNYQIMPNDRIYVNSKGLVRLDTGLARVISPVERIFGITLLGSTTVNSIRNNGRIGNTTP